MFSLPELPYGYEALEPVISGRTLHFHHDKHHAAYVKTTNELLEASGKSFGSLEEVVAEAQKSGEKKLFNNAAQAWNHAFFWESMTPDRAKPSGELKDAIEAGFGSLDELEKAFVTEGAGHFASGWVWLASDKAGDLKVVSTHDAANIMGQMDMTPLVVCDLWEHAYYLDYQNDRKGFLTKWFGEIPNWSFAARQYATRGKGGAWNYASAKPSTVSA
jgi:Fe-Mn family superoxide dismutase